MTYPIPDIALDDRLGWIGTAGSGKLAGPQQRILSVLIEAHPDQLTNAECASRAGYSHTSSGYTNPRGNLKTLNLIDYPLSGQCRASDWLFP